ncbi:MAG: late competence development ComFB family protein [Hormoscilla sp. SP5CHS1]|nr:late competence development ComFB family protein [Hormoscilla sp. SP12CHS1]MBC6455572.1 late competence development ComFB family protein [Hormoscilla sp. SP5CHS1]MBC6473569.1 late competence development ComFB family protein [Hormoscilla sp. GM102CHS1]
MKQLPPELADYINRVEVATYALDRLPPLYASSQEGRVINECGASKSIIIRLRQQRRGRYPGSWRHLPPYNETLSDERPL